MGSLPPHQPSVISHQLTGCTANPAHVHRLRASALHHLCHHSNSATASVCMQRWPDCDFTPAVLGPRSVLRDTRVRQRGSVEDAAGRLRRRGSPEDDAPRRTGARRSAPPGADGTDQTRLISIPATSSLDLLAGAATTAGRRLPARQSWDEWHQGMTDDRQGRNDRKRMAEMGWDR